MIRNKTLSLIVPCKNEEQIIGSFVRRVPQYVDEILVVDNNSTDRSVRLARKAGAHVLYEKRQIHGIGYGFAHIKGLSEATGDFIIAMDADDTYPLEEIRRIVLYMLDNQFDVVSCNRLPLKTPQAISVVRQLGIHILNTLVYLLYGYPMKDILTGMWVIRREAIKHMTLTQGDWNFSPEIKLEALTNPTIRFNEYHIDHFERIQAVSKQQLVKTGLSHVWYIINRWLINVLRVFAWKKGVAIYE